MGTTSPTTQNAPVNAEPAKDGSGSGQAHSPASADADLGQRVTEPKDNVKHATATMKYVVGALIAEGIFFFFKKRG